MSKEKISGIYKITNKINGNIYIGQSIDIYDRWKSHLKETRYGSSTHLHNAMRKYGKDNFTFEIIEKCEQDIINKREEYWISYFDSYNNGYNLTIGGDGIKGKVFTKQEREHKRKIQVDMGKNKPIIQFDLCGNIIKEWVGAKEISKKLGINCSSISACARKKDRYKTAYGYIWLFKSDYEKNGINLQYHLETLLNDTVYQINRKNEIINVWDNVLSIDNKYKKTPIYQCLDEKCISHKTSYGFVWVYKRNYKENFDYSTRFTKNVAKKEVYQYTKGGEFITTFDSLVSASKSTGISDLNIGHCVRHEQKTAGGFIWLFKDDTINIDKYVNMLKPKDRKKYEKNFSLAQYKQINLLNSDGEVIKTYNTASEAAKELGVLSNRVHAVCRNVYSHTKGYIFEYAS